MSNEVLRKSLFTLITFLSSVMNPSFVSNYSFSKPTNLIFEN